MKRRACLVAGLIATSSALVGCGSPAKRAVVAEVRQYYADFSERDWSAFSDHFWPGATLTTIWPPPGETEPRVVVTTVDDFVAQADEGPGSKEIFEERMTGAFVLVERDLAQVWATYEARFGDPGEIMEWEGIDAFTLMRHDGRWRIVSIAYQADE